MDFIKLLGQYLKNVQCRNRQNHCQTIQPTDIFISMNLLQMPCVKTWDQKNQPLTSEKNEVFFKVLNIKNLGSG